MDVLQKSGVGMVKRMKNIEKIKKDAETCLNHPPSTACNYCDLYSECDGCAEHIIKELYDLVVYYESRLVQVELERDAMAKIIEDATTYLEDFGSVKFALMQLKKWRGVCIENTKEEIHES